MERAHGKNNPTDFILVRKAFYTAAIPAVTANTGYSSPILHTLCVYIPAFIMPVYWLSYSYLP